MTIECLCDFVLVVLLQHSGTDVMQALPAAVVPSGVGSSHEPFRYHFKGQVDYQPVGYASLAQGTSSL